jgi:DNA polymerase/3'-5' exonuclease PolX
MSNNKKLALIFYRIAEFLEIKGVSFKPAAYRKAARFLEFLEKDISVIYKEKKSKEIKLPGIGKSIGKKIEEYLESGKVKDLQILEKETAIRQIITYFFESKGLSLSQLKYNARKRKIIYSRFTKPAKQLLELAGSIEKAEKAINKVAQWATSRDLDYSIETVFKKWLELDKLRPKEIVKKPYYMGNPMIWSEAKKKWYVIYPEGDWLEFADKKEKIEWKIAK